MTSNYENCIQVFYENDTPLPITISLYSLLENSVATLLGRSLAKNAVITLLLSPVASVSTLQGSPRLINLQPDYGYATVKVEEQGVLIYRHPHTLEELVAKPLQEQLRADYPNVGVWKYKLALPVIKSQLNFPAPLVADTVSVTPYAENENIPFGIRRAAEPPLPDISLQQFHLTTDFKTNPATLKVLLNSKIHQELIQQHHFSDQVEEGGFLVGLAYQDSDNSKTYIVQITAALPARHTGASLLHFTYTGDSFMAVKRLLREQHPNERILGWYHTHLFPAAIPMGLSSTDWNLHFTTFTQPWQVAGLINLDSPGRRTLRFYVKQGQLMVTCPYWIIS